MEIKECYRVLELELGASRDAVEAAYCRLLERWHPDRVTAGDSAAAQEAQRMVQAVNEAYLTLIKIAPGSAPDSASSRGPEKAPSLRPPNAPPTTRAKPTLPPWSAAQAGATRPPIPPPPPPSALPKKPVLPPASAPKPATRPMVAAPEPPPPKAKADLRSQAMAGYNSLFPPGSPRRRFGPLIVAGALVLLVLLFAKCVSKSPEQISADRARRIAESTGRLSVKSNRPNTTIEANLISDAGKAANSPHKGSEEGAAEQVLSALSPGKYALTARAKGWPDLSQEVNVEPARTTEITFQFKSGSLRLESEPNGAVVRWGETELGKTPLTIAQLPPGECQLEVQFPTWPAVSFKTAITENVEATATVHLPHGALTVESIPAGAAIRLGGRVVGQTPKTLEHLPAGPNKLNLKATDFPAVDVTVTVEDRGAAKINIMLGAGFPLLDPEALLRDVWVADNPDKLAPPSEGLTGPFQAKNGIVKNLHRKKLYENWLRKSFRFSSSVKSFDRDSGQIEFAEQKGDLSKYRVMAKLSPGARNDKDLVAQLAKGATITFYGHLTAVEESRWPAKVITLEFSDAEPLR